MESTLDLISTHQAVAAIKGQRVGYTRVSSVDQNLARQLDGVQLDITFADKASGKDMNRPQLQNMLTHVRGGDVVIVHSMDRLGRNLDDLRKLVTLMTAKGVHVHFLKENLIFTGKDSPMSELLLNMMGAFAQFERELLRERQREGIAKAKQNRVYKGRVRVLTDDEAVAMRARLALGIAKAKVAREFGISRSSMYNYSKVQGRLLEG